MGGIALVVISLGIVVLGAWLAWRGWRGRRVGDHPYCVACGFDLYGRPEGVDQCSECGAVLQSGGAIRIGQYAHRRRPLALGAALIVLGIALATPTTLVLVGAVDWQSRKPVWWLASEAQSSSATVQQAALGELLIRQKAGKLDAAQLQRLIDIGLAIQRDPKKTWQPQWGDFIENAALAGTLPADKLATYVKQGFLMQLEVRPRVRLGDAVPIQFAVQGERVGQGNRLLWISATSTDPLKVNGVAMKDGTYRFGGGDSSFGRGGFRSGSAVEPSQLGSPLVEGDVTVTGTCLVSIYQGPPRIGTLLSRFDLPLSAAMKVLPADQPSVTLVHDDSLRPAIERALTMQNYGQWQLACGPTPLPIDLAYTVFAVHPTDGREWTLGILKLQKGQKDHVWGLTDRTLPADVKEVDIVLRPSLDLARSSINLMAIWDGEIRIPHRKIVR